MLPFGGTISKLKPMPLVKGFAFDLEGTCIDVEMLHFGAYRATLAEKGIDISIDDIISIPGVIGGGSRFVIAEMERCYPEFSFADFGVRKKYYYEESLFKTPIQLREGLRDALEYLGMHQIPIALGSRTQRIHGEYMLNASGLNKYFTPENSVFFEDVVNEKPAPDVYLRTASMMNISPGAQCVFEDSVIGVQAGVAARSVVQAFPTSFSQGDRYVSALKCAGATGVFLSWEHYVPVLKKLLV